MKKILLTLFALIGSVTIFAASVDDEFTVDGVKYQIKSVTPGSESVDVAVQTDYANASLVIPASVTYDEVEYTVSAIKNMAFKGNTTITSVDISCKSVSSGAFQDCSNLATMTLNEGVTLLGGNNLRGTAITSLHLPASLTSLEVSSYNVSALRGNGLSSLTIADGNTAYELRDDGAVYSKDGKELAGFLYNYSKPFAEVPEGVETIAYEAFVGCQNMADTLILPSSLTSASGPFRGGANMKCVIVNCSGYTIYNLFQNDNDLEEIILGKNCKQIGQLSFKGCNNVKKITVLSETMPSWEYAANGAYPCFGEYDDPANNPFTNATVYVPCGQKATYQADANKWANFANIEEQLMYDVEVIAPNATFSISNTGECNQVTISVNPNDGFTFVNWDNGVNTPSFDCTVTSDTVITANIKKNLAVGDLFRANTTEGVSVLYKVLTKEPGSMTVQVGELNGFHGANYGQAIDKNYSGPLTISETVNYFDETYTVVALGSGAFSLCKITSLSLPNTVQKFDQNSIYECSKLKSVNIPEGITTIPRYNLSYMSALESITLPNSLEYICSGVFNSNTKLATIENWKPSQYKRVGNNIGAMNTKFFYDIPLDSYNVLYSGDIVLRQNVSANLDTLVIKEGTRIICGDLIGDETLTTIVLPASLEAIGDKSFNAMPNLTSCIIKATEPVEVYVARDSQDPAQTTTAANLKFGSTPEMATVKFYVPKASVSAYKESATWAGMDIRPIGGWTVTFKDHEGNVIGEPQQVEQGDAAVRPTEVDTYYTYDYMYTFANDWVVDANGGDTIYTAKYNEEALPKYKVHFYDNQTDAEDQLNEITFSKIPHGHAVTDDIANLENTYFKGEGNDVYPLECQKLTGWAGWSAPSKLDSIVSEQHIYPIWEDGATYTITFRDPIADENIVVKSDVECGEMVIAPAAPEHAGYVFKGWDNYTWRDEKKYKSDLIVNAVYDTATAIGNISGNGENAVKVLIDGHLFIRCGDKVYSADGQELK